MTLKEYRIKSGKTVREVAAVLGVNEQAVYQWESRKTSPTVQNYLKLSKLYGRTVDELLKVEND